MKLIDHDSMLPVPERFRCVCDDGCRCWRRATQEDGLCDPCRTVGCALPCPVDSDEKEQQ